MARAYELFFIANTKAPIISKYVYTTEPILQQLSL